MMIPKTSSAFKALTNADLHTKRIVLFLPTHDDISYASFINMPQVTVFYFDQPNLYEMQWEIIGYFSRKILIRLRKWFRDGVKYIRYNCWASDF